MGQFPSVAQLTVLKGADKKALIVGDVKQSIYRLQKKECVVKLEGSRINDVSGNIQRSRKWYVEFHLTKTLTRSGKQSSAPREEVEHLLVKQGATEDIAILYAK